MRNRAKNGQAISVFAGMLLAVLFALVAVQPAYAQVSAPPENPTIDAHQVNLPTGEVIMQRPGVAIGQGGNQGLSLSEYWVDDGWRYSELPTISGSSSVVVISFMGSTMSFDNDGSGNYTPSLANGASLTYASSTYTYVGAGGTQITFVEAPTGPNSELYLPGVSGLASPSQVSFPDGVVWDYHYRTDTWTDSSSGSCDDYDPECLPGGGSITYSFRRLVD